MNDWATILTIEDNKKRYKERVPKPEIRMENIVSFGPEGRPIYKEKLIKYMRFRSDIRRLDIFLLFDGSAIYSHGTYYSYYDHDNFSVSYRNPKNNKNYLLYPHEIEGIVYPNDGEDYKLLQQAISQYEFSKSQTAGGQTTKKRGPAKTKKRSIQ